MMGSPARSRYAIQEAAVLIAVLLVAGASATDAQDARDAVPLDAEPTAVALHARGITGVAYDAREGRWIWGARDGRLGTWRSETGPRVLYEAGSPLLSLAISPDSRYVAAASEEDGVIVFDGRADEVAFTLDAGPAWCGTVTFSPDARQLAAGCRDGRVRVWDIGTGSQIREYAIRPSASALAWSKDGRLLAAGGYSVVVWDTETRDRIHALSGHTGPVRGLAFTPGSDRLVSASLDHTARVWNTASGQLLQVLAPDGMTLRLEPQPRFAPISMPMTAVTLSRDGTLAYTAGADRVVTAWRLQDAAIVRRYVGPMMSLVAVATDGDGTIAAGALDGTLYLWPSGE